MKNKGCAAQSKYNPSVPHTAAIRTALGLLILIATPSWAQQETFQTLISQAVSEANADRFEQAVAITRKAIAAAKDDEQRARGFFLAGRFEETDGKLKAALGDYDQAIKLTPGQIDLINQRGGVHFKLGQIAESITDFDRAIELQPQAAPYHWQRGISLYYADRFADGRKQFEIHKTVNPHDVENAAWHFLCHARETNPKAARDAIIPIETSRDTRVPMAEIYALYAGRGTAERVIERANAETDPAAKQSAMFYAHLYLGLWHEAHARQKPARQHIKAAAIQFGFDHYMGHVAKVHWRRIAPEAKTDQPQKAPTP